MRNITLSIPDELYRAARIAAAERGQSLSAMVAEYLRTVTDRSAEFARLEALQNSVLAEIPSFNGSDRLTRDEVHDRAVR